MDQRRSDFRNASGPVTLFGEFTLSSNRKARCSVNLTEKDFIIQRLDSAPVSCRKVVLSLRDCVGSQAYRGDDGADPSAYFAAYFYPLKKRRWVKAAPARQRVEQCFRLAALQDPRANLEEAEKWARAVQERSARQQHLRDGALLSSLPRPCRLMLFVNPQSGKGKALTLYNSHIQPMLSEAGVIPTLIITERQNHAREKVREADLSQWDALVIISGDGLLHEVINGLLERADWEEAIRTPLGILPGGSGNALAASVHYYSGVSQVTSEELLVSCGFLLCKGQVSHMDLVSLHLSSNQRLFSFLSLAWGFVADVDVESEKYRHAGAARFTVGTLVRLASLRIYKGRLAYLPASRGSSTDKGLQNGAAACSTPSSAPRPLEDSFPNTCHSNNSLKLRRSEGRCPQSAPKDVHGPPDSLLPPLDQPLPSDWVLVPQEDFVLMLAMFQSHLAEDLLAAPDARLDDGVIHLFYVTAGISRKALLRLFLAMEKGAHLDTNCQQLVHVKVRALRLEPGSGKGVITVDGEVVDYGPIQAEVHRGLGRLISG
ncbi:sphingosine kinase 1-like [Cyprinodon tularosa]|uniref:sphingosine kinase 1-like n=1 Tax=Cyprinodon tularosa TaxID=77115 RepID=UPI0018E2482E|nr:sphingosine kinase 1-like [Cyprinodon tularosa]